jgi:HKD family nuclease
MLRCVSHLKMRCVKVNSGKGAELLLPQLDGRPFGPRLRKELEAAQQVDIAAAWVRASGVRHIREALEDLLGRGGSIRVVVGLDADNTSTEGLRELAAIGDAAPERATFFVRHNEAYAVYHPKVYAIRTAAECRVLVGSNNLTGAGLFVNEEMSALLQEKRGGKLEGSLDAYFAELCDLASGLVKPLTPAFIDQLVQHGYVRPEATLPGKSKNRARRKETKGEALFAFKAPKRAPPKPPAPPEAPRIEPQADEPAADWNRVFIRLRLARGTQAQIPATVVRALRARLGLTPQDGPLDVAIAGSQDRQMISPAYTKKNKSGPNTYKFEAFAPTGNPLLRMEVVGQDVIVQKLDSGDAAGAIVEKFILDGLTTDPPQTFRRRHTENATLWRFD